MTHETPTKKMPVAPAGVGADCADQDLPFQRCTSTADGPSFCPVEPTAVHADADEHETA